MIVSLKRGDEILCTPNTEVEPERNQEYVTQGKVQSELTSKYLNMNIFRADDNELYVYDEKRGCYDRLSDSKAMQKLLSLLPENRRNRISTKTLEEVLKRLKYQPNINMQKDDMNANPKYINCKNGVIDLESGKLLEHEKSYNFTYCINANYLQDSEKVSLPEMQKFCDASLEANEEKKQLLMEIIGYLLSDYNNAKKAFIFLGKPHSGKSLLSKIITYLIGDKNVSNIPFHKLGERFSNAELSIHKLNINAELDSTPIRKISNFKAIVGNDTLSAEFKGKDLFSFKAKTKLLFCGNYMPELKDVEITEAFMDRLVFLMFNRSTPKDEIDYDLEEKIIKEIDSVFTVAMDCLKELIKRNFRFIIPKDSQKFIKDYASRQNNVNEFINERCKLCKDVRVHTKTLYDSYLKFCEANCIAAYTSNKFSEYIAAIDGVTRSRFRLNTENLRGFIGIAIKEI